MKILADFFPVILFYIAYKVSDIYVATGVAMAACLLQVGGLWLLKKRIETVHWVTLFMVVIFGGATLLLHDEQFIKWKPTIINWLFGVVFLGSQFFGKPLVQRMMGASLKLPDLIWQRLNLMWAAFFLSVGGLNLYVMRTYDTDTWADFKLFGMLGLTVLFLIAQGLYLMRHIEPNQSKETEQED